MLVFCSCRSPPTVPAVGHLASVLTLPHSGLPDVLTEIESWIGALPMVMPHPYLWVDNEMRLG